MSASALLDPYSPSVGKLRPAVSVSTGSQQSQSLEEFFRLFKRSPYTRNVKADHLLLSQGEPYQTAAFVRPAEPEIERALRDSKSSFKVLVSRVSMHLGFEWLQKLFAQIDSLLDIEEWDEKDPIPALETARTFIRLLLILKVKRKPGIGISNAGNLIAAWTTGQNRLTVECLPSDRVRWIVARMNEGEIERAVGEGRIDRLRDLLQPYEPSVWFEYAE